MTPREKWVEALRSGKYTQGRDQLRTAYDGIKHCCLGVACEVAIEEGVIDVYYPGASRLPDEVRDWIGLTSAAGTFNLGAQSLIRLNDTEQYTFEQIADVIEAEPQGLFV